jgi:hypothetical protein
MSTINKFLAVCFIFFFCSIRAYADGYWLEVNGSGKLKDSVSILIRYGGVNEQQERYIKMGKDLDKLKTFVLWIETPDGKKEYISIKRTINSWEGYYVPKNKGKYRIFAMNEQLPVVKRKDSLDNVKPIQFLCTDYNVQTNKSKPVKDAQFLDMNVIVKNDTAFISAFRNKKPLNVNDSIRIFFPDNHDEKFAFGQLGTPLKVILKNKGRYLLRIDWEEPQKGIWKNDVYFATRYRYDYTLEMSNDSISN